MPISDLTNGIGVHSEASADRNVSSNAGANRKNIGFCQFVDPLNSSRVDSAAFGYLVPHVVEGSSIPEMGRVAARRVVARMTAKNRQSAVCQKERNPVGGNRQRWQTKLAVAGNHSAGSPKPTLIVSAPGHLRPKANHGFPVQLIGNGLMFHTAALSKECAS